jgi:glucose dehydrogenase
MRIKVVSCLIVITLGAVAMAQPSRQPNSPCGMPRNRALIDWAQFHFDSCHTGYNPYEFVLGPQTVGKLVLAWKYQVYPTNNIGSSPSIANGVLYFGTDMGSLYALDARTGVWLWGAFVGENVMVGTPAVAYGNVYVAGNNGSFGMIHAFNAATGAPGGTGATAVSNLM